MSFQLITILGNIGQAASVKQVSADTVVNFSVAVNKKWTDSNGTQQERTTWFDCAKWFRAGQSTKVADWLTGGSQVLVTGEVSGESYTARDGSTRVALRLLVDSITLANTKPRPDAPSQSANGAAAPVGQGAPQAPQTPGGEIGDLPF